MGELLELFDAVVESSVEGVRKPEPEIYRRALARLSAAAGSFFFEKYGRPARRIACIMY